MSRVAEIRALVERATSLVDRWFAPAPLTRSPIVLVLVLCANAMGLAVLVRTVRATLGPMYRTPAPRPVPQPTSMERFGMTETIRREIFAELADAEVNERRRAITMNTWGGHAWSREDDLGYVQRARAREVAQRYRVSLSQVFLVLDEGIRRRWPGPDGLPLRGTSEPISLRRE